MFGSWKFVVVSSQEHVAKRAKTDPHVVYLGPEHGPFKCGRCQYFSPPNACEKVKGTIDGEACCNLFERKVVKPKSMAHGDLKWMDS